jgi:plastocyanin
MKYTQNSRRRAAVVTAVSIILATASTTRTLQAREWQAWVGAQGPQPSSQALAFLPNELWIHTNDSVRWTIASTEIHTVTFLTAVQPKLPLFNTFLVQNGCGLPTPITPDGASFDGSSCVNSGIMGTFDTIVGPRTYSVKFPTPGNFKFTCLVHADMTGAIHVLDPSQTLRYDQDFYNREAQSDATALVAEATSLTSQAMIENNDGGPFVKVAAGISTIRTKSGAGSQTPTLFLFLRKVIVIRIGDTVEWTSLDQSDPHTVTFGTEPADPRPPSLNVKTQTPDGAREAVIGSPADSVNSGLLVPSSQDRIGSPQAPLGATRFRVTFTSPGSYNYICALHDNLGMKGTIIVNP